MKVSFFLFIFLFSLISLSFVSGAQPTLGVFKQYDCMNLIQTCDNCSYVNISSVNYPNSSIALSNVNMTKDDTYYTYPFCSTIDTGEYKVNGYGDDDGKKTIWVYTFIVNPSGKEQSSFMDNPLPLIFLALAIIFLIIGVTLEISWLGFISSIMFLLGGVWVMIYGFNDVTNWYTRGVGLTLIGVAFTIMFISAYEWIMGDEGGEHY